MMEEFVALSVVAWSEFKCSAMILYHLRTTAGLFAARLTFLRLEGLCFSIVIGEPHEFLSPTRARPYGPDL